MERLTAHGLISDDAFFYPVIAENLFKKGFFTFDGEMPTNGFQPLWMYLLLLGRSVLGPVDGMVFLNAASFVCYVLFSLLFLSYATREAARPVLTAILAGLLVVDNTRFQEMVFTGLETPLFLLILMSLVLWVERIEGKASGEMSLKDLLVLSLLASLLFYARTDWFVAAIVLFFWLKGKRIRVGGSSPGKDPWIMPAIGPFTLAVTLLVCPYLLYNWLHYGHVVPISGMVKKYYLARLYPDLTSYLSSGEWHGLFSAVKECMPLVTRFPFFLSFALVLSVYLGFLLQVLRSRQSPLPSGIRLLGFLVISHDLVMYVIYRELRPYGGYYFAASVLWLTLLVCFWADRTWTRNKREWSARFLRTVVFLMVLDGLFLAARWVVRQEKPYWAARVALARDVAAIVPREVPVGAFWPGSIAYLSGYRIIPLDGVIASWEYFTDYVKKGRELLYLQEKATPYLAVYLYGPPDRLLAENRPSLRGYSTLYLLRMWEMRRELEIDVLSFHQVGKSPGEGWYLLRLW